MTSRSGSIGIALLVAHLVVVGGVVVVVVTAGAYSMKQFYSQQSATFSNERVFCFGEQGDCS